MSRTIQANVLSLISQVMTFVLYKANLGLWFCESKSIIIRMKDNLQTSSLDRLHNRQSLHVLFVMVP